MIVTSAPGKLMLTGEYAVLEGAPALVAAVDRRVRVRIAPRPATGEPGITIASDLPGAGEVSVRTNATDTPHQGARFVLRALQEVMRRHRGLVDPDIGRIEVLSASLRAGPAGAKYGLGSSAAVAVALTAAFIESFGGSSAPGAVAELARPAHRAAVGGAGSGVDVAASTFGGLAAYRLGSGRLRRAPKALPSGIHTSVFWSGRSADTSEFLRQVRAHAQQCPAAYRSGIDALGEAADDAVRACDANHADAFLGAIAGFARAMDRFGRQAGVPIVSEPHARIGRLAASHGAVAKPSGAGGGDIAVAFSPSESVGRELEARVAAAGFPVVPARTTLVGVHTDSILERSAP